MPEGAATTLRILGCEARGRVPRGCSDSVALTPSTPQPRRWRPPEWEQGKKAWLRASKTAGLGVPVQESSSPLSAPRHPHPPLPPRPCARPVCAARVALGTHPPAPKSKTGGSAPGSSTCLVRQATLTLQAEEVIKKKVFQPGRINRPGSTGSRAADAFAPAGS